MEQERYPVPVGGIQAQENEGALVLPPEPQEAIHWLRARKVFEALQQPGVNHIQEACEIAQVPRTTFYRDISHPSIPPKLAQWLTSVTAAASAMILSNWVQVIQHQIRIANGEVGSPREATPAARFVQDELKRLEAQVMQQQGGGPSDAAKILAKFKAKKATRTTVVEEIELE